MPTLAFYNARSRPIETLLDDVMRWFAQRIWTNNSIRVRVLHTFSPFMARLQGEFSDFYLRATDEALEILKWIRQFVDAV